MAEELKADVEPLGVGDLLAASHAAHTEYRRQCGRTVNVGGQIQLQNGDPVAAAAALELAGAYRKQAHDLDPTQTDPAWRDPAELAMGGHDALLTFYAEIGGRAEHVDALRIASARTARAERVQRGG